MSAHYDVSQDLSPWPAKAQEALDNLYKSLDASTVEQKIKVHKELNDNNVNVSSATGQITRFQVLRVHEHAYLFESGLIEVHFL